MIRIRVFGVPAGQGSKRFVRLSKAGRGVMIESSKKVKPWREDVVNAVLKQTTAEQRGLNVALSVGMEFILKGPDKMSRKRRERGCGVPPDLSKLARSTEDAITTSGLWKDDGLVVNYHQLTKRYATEGEALGCNIEVRPA